MVEKKWSETTVRRDGMRVKGGRREGKMKRRKDKEKEKGEKKKDISATILYVCEPEIRNNLQMDYD